MLRDLNQLANNEFDLLVVGGGITGACILWDIACRGLSVALIEKADFGHATSSASSKIIHGGIRYLQQGVIQKVRESALEQRTFARIAPHLIHRIPFLVPTYGHWSRGKEFLTLGMLAYEGLRLHHGHVLDPQKDTPRFDLISKSEALDICPTLPQTGLTGAVRFYECQMHDSERTTLAFILAAGEKGATVANYVEAIGLLRRGRVEGVRARDMLTGESLEIRASLVVCATGPWGFRLASYHASENAAPPVSLGKGIHILTARAPSSHALALATRMKNQAIVNRGGRHIFFIPWRSHCLIGTTYSPFADSPDEVSVTESDIAELLREIDAALPQFPVKRPDVLFAYAGLYPLIGAEQKNDVYRGSGRYQIYDHVALNGIEGVITVIGARFTTARKLAEKTASLVFRKFGYDLPKCSTDVRPLYGGAMVSFEEFQVEAIRAHSKRFDKKIITELTLDHGSRFEDLLVLATEDPTLAELVTPNRPVLRAAVAHSAESEMAMTLSDVLFRRTSLGKFGHPGESCLLTCAQILAKYHNWDLVRLNHELDCARRTFALFL